MRNKTRYYEELAKDCIKTNQSRGQDIGEIVADMERRMNERIDEANRRVIEKVESIQNQGIAQTPTETVESVVENENNIEEDSDNENN